MINTLLTKTKRKRPLTNIGILRLNVTSLLVLCLIPLALFGCQISPTKEPTPDEARIGTIAAQTVSAQLAFLTATAEAQPSQTTVPSETATEPPQATIAPASPIVPTTQLVYPIISATVDTNCRVGPSPQYARISYLAVGQTANVRGRNEAGTWWYIENPQNKNSYCWVWADTTQVSGEIASLPVITPPPATTVMADNLSFQAVFSNIHACGGSTFAVFGVSNNGSTGFQSGRVAIKDMTTGSIIAGPSVSNAAFLRSGSGCPPGEARLKPGQNAFIAIELPFKLPAGSPARATLTLCIQPNMAGNCAETKVNFTFP